VGSGAKPQPTKDLVHIHGQNNSFRSNILGFAGEKIENVAKLKQKGKERIRARKASSFGEEEHDKI